MSASQQRWIARADTFFIARAHPEHEVDAWHRGSNPGFVKVEDTRALTIGDYSGMRVNPRAGLVYPDFESARTLQLSGRATIDWDAERRGEFSEVERLHRGRDCTVVPLGYLRSILTQSAR